jgi:hypothetical protein
LFLSWLPVDNPGSVHDYEVGFSTTKGSSAPDLMAFRSTKQHPHLHVSHTDVPDGAEFYVIIKTISKANVEGIQVGDKITGVPEIVLFLFAFRYQDIFVRTLTYLAPFV